MKTILLLLSSDRFAHPLMRYLAEEGKTYGWKLTIGSMYDHALFEKLSAEHPGFAILHLKDAKQCDKEIRRADVIIGLMNDVMLLKVADTCIAQSKTLISPTRLNRQLFAKRSQAEENDAFILVECGFTPGLDHITSKKMIDHIHAKGGSISSFKTFSGSLIAESSADNPWAFKLTTPATELFNFGRGNNRFLVNGQLQHVPYHQLFLRAQQTSIEGLGDVVVVPEEDGLYCRKIYDLPEAGTVMKGRIVRKGFESIWDLVLRLGLTNNAHKVEMPDDRSFRDFMRSLVPYAEDESLEALLRKFMNASTDDIEKLRWLGLFDEAWFEGTQELTPALILQYLIENKMSMADDDRDVTVIRHEVEYSLNSYRYKFNATLISEGEDYRHSALGRAIGMTTGAAAKAVLVGNIRLKGIHTPVRKEIYDPMLNELEDQGVAFRVEETRTAEVESGEIAK